MKRSRRDAPLEPGAHVDMLPGLGPSARTALAEHGLRTVADLAWVAPVAWDDLRAPVSVSGAIADAKRRLDEGAVDRPPRIVVAGVVKSSGAIFLGRRRGVRVVIADAADDKCTLHAFWFFMAHGVLAAAKPGTPVLAVGRIKVEKGKPARTAHPDMVVDAPESRVVRPRYPRLGPPEAAMRRAIAAAALADLDLDPVPAAIRAREGLTDARALLRRLHATANELPEGVVQRAFVERMAWAEAFTRTWERLRHEATAAAATATPLPRDDDAVRRLERELGFVLTPSQRKAIGAIAADLAGPRPMRRLLLGDVGSGKTAVALAAVAQCIAAGKQAAILAPTSVLAEQYVDAVAPLVRAMGVRVAFLAASVKADVRRREEQSLANGEARVAIGTHALLGEGIVLPDLALVVVDEQQRLGVAQRLSLVAKGKRPHLLSLSATPIPRTLALALRGELATSTLDERPKGRKPPTTRLVPRSALAEVLDRVRDACDGRGRVFWVVPRIQAEGDEDGDVEVASAIARADHLRRAGCGSHPWRVVLLHGAMKSKDKSEAMRAFRRGEADVLVATTVVEVGVDVPEATLMVVEDAERFGLAQLHQLRGRVGRGDAPSTCILLHDDSIDHLARARLDALAAHDDGAAIARADLELRGAGDLGGTRQHGGESELEWLDPAATYPWLERIVDDACTLHASDPALERHPVLASFVRRFGRGDEARAVREEAG